MQERRSENRMMCADMVDVCWREPTGKSRRMTALLEDISPSGACLQLDIPVPIGARFRWSTADRQFTGRVQYCVYREIGYYVGVEFDAGTRWSKQDYRPRHLLDLERLLAGMDQQ
jgi:hypothetical protein